MVKTRHSDELPPLNEPEFMSLNNERQRRQSIKTNDEARDVHASRAYNTEGSNAFNIFEEKVVDSRLRPRTGPGAYNYLDADSSEDDMKYHTRRFSNRREYSFSQSSGDRLEQRQVKREMIKEDIGRPRKLVFRGRDLLQDGESDGTDQNEKSFNKYLKRSKKDQDYELRTRKRKGASLSPDMKGDGEEESDKEPHTSRQRSTRLKQTQQQQSSDEELEEMGKASNSRTRIHRQQNREEQEEEEEDQDGDEGTEIVRRSSRKRRQIFDTLNQSYIVNLPGKRGQEDTKDGDSDDDNDDDDEGNNQEFSDMYSRVKRKRVQVKRNMYGVPINDDSESDEDDELGNTNNNKDDEEDEEEEEEEEEDMENGNDQNKSGRVLRKRKSSRRPQPQRTVKSYSLRQHKPRTDLYKAPVEARRVRRAEQSVFASTPTKTTSSKQPYQSPAHRRKIRKRSAFHSSSSSTSSSESESSDEKNFKRRKEKSMAKARNRMMPMNMTADVLASSSVLKDRVKSGVSLADVEPMNIDKNVTFDSIGGLGKHIRKLKEMVVFPLLYDNVFQRFKVDPPRGVLFYGPPGTGKTLVARALANECSQGDRRVAFFMRKGADCLSKWVGESERQLRLLFDQAYKFRPSIIFFDEIDGLAPVRSSRQDQIHSSIVSTLLALMDGLDSRGEIVVIGATNRIDSLDPALRRPGRFDREFLFPLPSLEARKQILKIHTSSWNPRLNDQFLTELAEKCVGYCGADLKALCTETAMQALRRRYPQIYLTNEALQLDVSSINVSAKDFYNAIVSIIPTSQRSVNTPARGLAPRLVPLLEPQLHAVMIKLGDIFPPCLEKESSLANAATLNQAKDLTEGGVPWEELLSDEDENAPSIFMPSTSTSKWNKTSKNAPSEHMSSSLSLQPGSRYLNFISCATTRPTIFRPRLMLVGCEGQAQTTHLAPAVIHQMENLPCHVLDLPTLYAVTAKTPEESCANVFHEAKRKCPSILYLPYIDQWWDVMADTLRATLLTLIHDLDPALPLLLLATSERPYHMLDPTLRSLFSAYSCEVSTMRNPNKDERHAFFKDLLLVQIFKAPPQKKQAEVLLKHLTKEPKELLKKGKKKSKVSKSSQSSYFPNFIYPFGRFEDCKMQPRKKETKQDSSLQVKKGFISRGKDTAVQKSSLAKMNNLKLKLYTPPTLCQSNLKPSHRMVLRSKGHVVNHLNSNQSARSVRHLHACEIFKSSCPAVQPNRFTKLKSARQCRKARHKKGKFHRSKKSKQRPSIMHQKASRSLKVKTPFTNGKGKFKKPSNAFLRSTKAERMPLFQFQPYTSKGLDCLNCELSCRQERYLRRLQRLEARMSKVNRSVDAGKQKLYYCALSDRHLRYLRRLRRVDAALQQANSLINERKYYQQHCPLSSTALSCGSFQMLYKKKDNYECKERNLSLPLNLKALAAPREMKKQKKKFEGSVSEWLQDKKPSSFESGFHYNLRNRRREQYAQHMLETLPLAAPSKPRDLSPEELAMLEEKEELTLMELRIFLRDVLNKLGTDKKFSIFAKPVNIEDAADYYDIIEHPMDLSSMMAKIDLHEYSTVRDFLNDIDLICSNALEYNPDRGPMDRVIRHRACALKDTAYAIIKTELDKEFEKTCVNIQESRKRRGQKSSTVPNFYNTRLRHGNSSKTQAPTASSTSYLVRPQLARTIPEPDGERFSRRVRGLKSDPVPSLEAVEKVFKSSRSGVSPSRENVPNDNGKVNKDDNLDLSKKEQDVEKGDQTVSDVNVAYEEALSGLKKTPIRQETKDGKTNCKVSNLSTSGVSTSEKKRSRQSACVWCKPRRKRRCLTSKVAVKTNTTEKELAEDPEEEDGDEVSLDHEEELEEERDDCNTKQDLPKVEVDHQLAIDTSEDAAKMDGSKIPEQKGKATCSPATVPLGVSTRRSSMSPRMVSTPVQMSTKTADTLKEEKSNGQTSAKVLNKTEGSAVNENKTSNKHAKDLLLGSSAECSSTSQSENHITSSINVDKPIVSGELGMRERPSVVKRLDLNMVITDSGHGSSLESNGDSRDSTDQKDGMRAGQSGSPLSKALPAIEALANLNHNCSLDLQTKAAAILSAPSQAVVTDLPRMTQLLSRLVERTEGHTVERLEKIYSQLSQLIYKHRYNYNKTPVMEAMEKKVEDFTTTIPGTSKQ
ncbi:hypothetical protein EGW08_010726 [Elysia chlorotica]|uniref:Bromo domain-containing protein n=1 Tax=Elysia chlorotica TaxID=188477 RepID=A0A3S1A348_ELYCH|nr:hypothetical protein EGW08_010726 [Elysia chlorotica]